ncbi:uncharacterized protein LOC142651757 [Rhinoderma darwinii]|uniref:uncharacterized protein LOC142651757 n=1 Tax=Rhinoderma darwinii TaxID=43563 RepID=UPI003F6663EB
MKKALNFLETFEIDNELEATTVARLCEKLTTNLKFFNNKARADALFPVRVARAQDVAMSLMQNAERQNTNLQNPTQKKSKPKIPPQPNKRPPAFPGNPNLNQNVGMQSGFPGPNFQNLNAGMQSGFPGPNFQNLNPGMQSGFPGPNFQNLNAGMQSGFPGPNFQNHNAGMQSGFPGPNFQNLNAGMQSGAPGPNVQNLNAGMQSGVPGQNFQNRNAGMQSGVPGQNFQNRNAGMQSGVPGQNFQNPNAGMQSGFPGQNIQNPNAGMQSGFPGRNFQNSDPPKNMPQAPLYQKPQQHPFAPSIKKQAMQGGPSMPKIKVNAPKAENTQSDAFLKDISQEDTQFFSKLMSLLEALPQNASLSDNTQMNSKLLMLKSMMVNQKSAEHEQANQKLMTQLASLVQDTISAQNASLNQQLMMLMSSQNSTSMVMQTASLRNTTMAAGTIQVNENSVMNRAGIVPGIQGLGNMQTNVNSLMPFNQNFGKQACGQMGENASRPMDRNAYQGPQVEMQTYPSTSQNYDNSVERNYLPQGDPYVRQKDGTVNSLTSGQNEKMIIPSTDVGYKPSAYDKEWDSSYYGDKSTPVPEPRYVDHTEEQTPYTRVSLSPSSAQNKYDDYTRGEVGTQDTRHRHDLNSSRSYNSSEWEDQESDMRYNKRAKLDMNDRSDRLESYNNRSLESRGINTAGMPDELLKRIQGKDLFTVSAIISEYSERRSGK